MCDAGELAELAQLRGERECFEKLRQEYETMVAELEKEKTQFHHDQIQKSGAGVAMKVMEQLKAARMSCAGHNERERSLTQQLMAARMSCQRNQTTARLLQDDACLLSSVLGDDASIESFKQEIALLREELKWNKEEASQAWETVSQRDSQIASLEAQCNLLAAQLTGCCAHGGAEVHDMRETADGLSQAIMQARQSVSPSCALAQHLQEAESKCNGLLAKAETEEKRLKEKSEKMEELEMLFKTSRASCVRRDAAVEEQVQKLCELQEQLAASVERRCEVESTVTKMQDDIKARDAKILALAAEAERQDDALKEAILRQSAVVQDGASERDTELLALEGALVAARMSTIRRERVIDDLQAERQHELKSDEAALKALEDRCRKADEEARAFFISAEQLAELEAQLKEVQAAADEFQRSEETLKLQVKELLASNGRQADARLQEVKEELNEARASSAAHRQREEELKEEMEALKAKACDADARRELEATKKRIEELEQREQSLLHAAADESANLTEAFGALQEELQAARASVSAHRHREESLARRLSVGSTQAGGGEPSASGGIQALLAAHHAAKLDRQSTDAALLQSDLRSARAGAQQAERAEGGLLHGIKLLLQAKEKAERTRDRARIGRKVDGLKSELAAARAAASAGRDAERELEGKLQEHVERARADAAEWEAAERELKGELKAVLAAHQKGADGFDRERGETRGQLVDLKEQVIAARNSAAAHRETEANLLRSLEQQQLQQQQLQLQQVDKPSAELQETSVTLALPVHPASPDLAAELADAKRRLEEAQQETEAHASAEQALKASIQDILAQQQQQQQLGGAFGHQEAVESLKADLASARASTERHKAAERDLREQVVGLLEKQADAVVLTASSMTTVMCSSGDPVRRLHMEQRELIASLQRQLKKERMRSDNDVKLLESELSIVRDEKKTMREELINLKVHIEDAKDEKEDQLQTALAQAANLESEIRALQGSQESVKQELAAELEKAMEKVQQLVKEKEASVVALSGELEAKKTEMASMSDEMALLQAGSAELKELQAAMKQKQDEFDFLQLDVATKDFETEQTNEKIAELEGKYESSRMSCARRSEAVHDKEQELVKVKRLLTKTTKDMGKYKKLADYVPGLKAEVKELKKLLLETTELKESNELMTSEIEELKDNIKEKDAELQNLAREAEDAKNAGKGLEDDVRRQRRELESLRKNAKSAEEWKGLRSKLERVLDMNVKLRRKLQERQREVLNEPSPSPVMPWAIDTARCVAAKPPLLDLGEVSLSCELDLNLPKPPEMSSIPNPVSHRTRNAKKLIEYSSSEEERSEDEIVPRAAPRHAAKLALPRAAAAASSFQPTPKFTAAAQEPVAAKKPATKSRFSLRI